MIDIDKICLDIKDFLCPAFQGFDYKSEKYYPKQLRILKELFSTRIERYFTQSCKSQIQQYRIAMATLACFDPLVVETHLKNQNVIAGRCGTHFQSAFFVQDSIGPEDIISCQIVSESYITPRPYISLPDFQSGNIR